MKLSKNTWTIIAVIGVIVLIYWLMTKNKKEESGFDDKKGGATRGATRGATSGATKGATSGATKGGSSGSSGSKIWSWTVGGTGTCWIGSQCNCIQDYNPDSPVPGIVTYHCKYTTGIGNACCSGTIPRPVQGGGSAGVN